MNPTMSLETRYNILTNKGVYDNAKVIGITANYVVVEYLKRKRKTIENVPFSEIIRADQV